MTDIVYVITSSDFGGAQNHILSLCKSVSEQGRNVCVISGEHGTLIERLNALGIATLVEPSLKRRISPFHDILAIWKLAYHFRNLKPLIVHCHSSKAGMIGRAAARISRVPVVLYTAHGFIFNEVEMSSSKKRFYIFCEIIGGWLSDGIIAVSQADRQAAIRSRVIPADKLTVIYNGIPIIEHTKLRKPPGPPVIGTVARFVREKNLKLWLDTASIIRRSCPACQFVIVGDGPLADVLKEYAQTLGLTDIQWAGQQPDIMSYLKTFDVFLITSVKEGLPTTAIESLGVGVPVVSTEAGGIKEIIDDRRCGLVVSSFDPHAISGAVLEVLSSEAQDEWASVEHRQNKQRSKFAVSLMADRTMSYYQKLLAQKGMIW